MLGPLSRAGTPYSGEAWRLVRALHVLHNEADRVLMCSAIDNIQWPWGGPY